MEALARSVAMDKLIYIFSALIIWPSKLLEITSHILGFRVLDISWFLWSWHFYFCFSFFYFLLGDFQEKRRKANTIFKRMFSQIFRIKKTSFISHCSLFLNVIRHMNWHQNYIYVNPELAYVIWISSLWNNAVVPSHQFFYSNSHYLGNLFLFIIFLFSI